MRRIALLRAINVGTGRRVPMKDLAALIEDAGGSDVRTYIQSGNVVFDHAERGDEKLRDDLEARLEAAFGFEIAVMLRSAADWRRIMASDPFPGVDRTKLLVLFLRDKPAPKATDAVDAAAFAPEEFVLAGREAFLHLPAGIGRAKLPAALARALGVPGTGRNWRTVLKLGELAGA